MFLPWVRSVALAAITMMGGLTPEAFAKSTDASVDGDTKACLEASDNDACKAVYDYLRGSVGEAKDGDLPALHAKILQIGTTGCELGNGWLCNSIGFAHAGGRNGLSVDDAVALSYYLKACSAGTGSGCANAGLAYQMGVGVEKDQAKAEALLIQGCEMGSMGACQNHAGWLLSNRVAAEPAATASIASLKADCIDLVVKSCLPAGVAYFRGSGGVGVNKKEAGQYWSKGCREIHDATACFYVGLRSLRDVTITDRNSPTIIAGLTSVVAACQLGHTEACEYVKRSTGKSVFNQTHWQLRAAYQLCAQKPTLEDCELAGKSYGTPDSRVPPYTYMYTPAKATLAWLNACRFFGKHCVKAANMHLKARAPAVNSPNLAIGILETACSKGDEAACARKAEVIAETGGVTGSYIDPMASDDERYLLAKFDLENGDLGRGRETLQWLAYTGHTDAELELAIAYWNGMHVISSPHRGSWEVNVPLYNKTTVMYELFERAASKGIPGAAMRIAVHRYEENDHEGRDSYEFAIARALYMGAEGAKEFAAAVSSEDQARLAARARQIDDLNRRNVEQRGKMDRETVQRAWDQYAQRQKEEEERSGGEVCGVVHGPGNSRYHTCMSRDAANKYYRGDF